jgi:hypothetical protein
VDPAVTDPVRLEALLWNILDVQDLIIDRIEAVEELVEVFLDEPVELLPAEVCDECGACCDDWDEAPHRDDHDDWDDEFDFVPADDRDFWGDVDAIANADEWVFDVPAFADTLDDPTSVTGYHYDDADGNPAGGHTIGIGIDITWQEGPLGRGADRIEPNGAFIETVIAAALDRLEYYQKSRFNCRENALTITKLEEALHWCKHRTDKREAREVEGTHGV